MTPLAQGCPRLERLCVRAPFFTAVVFEVSFAAWPFCKKRLDQTPISDIVLLR